ncbi:MAG: M48 family metalloprotease [Cyanothece sp. SIO1E1]|nr:M48 family metalloprotease [Cyanothece sp. SIO1E1]
MPSSAQSTAAPSEPPLPAPAAPAHSPTLTAEAAEALLKTGHKTLKAKNYAEAVTALEAYCHGADPAGKDYTQAQSWLVKAYKGNDQIEAAIALCRRLTTHEKKFTRLWAEQFLQTLAPAAQPESVSATTQTSAQTSAQVPTTSDSSPEEQQPQPIPKAGRASQWGVSLAMRGVAANLSLASGITISLLFGMVLVLSLSLLLIVGHQDPLTGLLLAVALTLAFNAVTFFIAPFIMDLVQGLLYGTRWVSLSQVERHSPEAVRVIRTVCQQHKLKQPRLGIIDDQNPTAFTYGSLPNTARLVVSQGLFTYLDDDEAATVYAHELGHIVHWDFAVMTLAATLVQVAYLLYITIKELPERLGDNQLSEKIQNATQSAAIMAYVFYVVGEYLVLYLSRTREYYADHFAAETTGNPNGLARALVKIAYGIVEEGQRAEKPSKLVQGTRALGIYDAKAAGSTGTAYRVASEPQKVGRVFLWDMFNPWAWWLELSSTHPLTGKRVRALSTYAEQLGLGSEFDMARVVRDGNTLNKRRLYGNFILDLLLLRAEVIGLVIGLGLGLAILTTGYVSWTIPLSLALIGFGAGTLGKIFIIYPESRRAPAMDVLTLMSDPYASPLRGRFVKLAGEVIGRGNPGNRFSSDLKMQDPTGMILLRYSSRFGPLGNFLFGMTQADAFVRRQVATVGWFRRGVAPWIDLMRMECPEKWTVNSYHRFWLVLLGLGSLVLGFILPAMAS